MDFDQAFFAKWARGVIVDDIRFECSELFTNDSRDSFLMPSPGGNTQAPSVRVFSPEVREVDTVDLYIPIKVGPHCIGGALRDPRAKNTDLMTALRHYPTDVLNVNGRAAAIVRKV
jgi:hypothetical protein